MFPQDDAEPWGRRIGLETQAIVVLKRGYNANFKQSIGPIITVCRMWSDVSPLQRFYTASNPSGQRTQMA